MYLYTLNIIEPDYMSLQSAVPSLHRPGRVQPSPLGPCQGSWPTGRRSSNAARMRGWWWNTWRNLVKPSRNHHFLKVRWTMNHPLKNYSRVWTRFRNNFVWNNFQGIIFLGGRFTFSTLEFWSCDLPTSTYPGIIRWNNFIWLITS